MKTKDIWNDSRPFISLWGPATISLLCLFCFPLYYLLAYILSTPASPYSSISKLSSTEFLEPIAFDTLPSVINKDQKHSITFGSTG